MNSRHHSESMWLNVSVSVAQEPVICRSLLYAAERFIEAAIKPLTARASEHWVTTSVKIRIPTFGNEKYGGFHYKMIQKHTSKMSFLSGL